MDENRFAFRLIDMPPMLKNKLRKNSKKKRSYTSNKIEGNPLTEQQAYEAIDNNSHKHFLKPEQEVRNYFMALNFFDAKVAASLALFTIVIQEILYAVSCRNLKEFAYKQGLFSNKYMNIGLLIVLAIEFLVFLTPIGSFIGLVQLDIFSLILIFLFNFVGLFLYEIGKPILKRLFKD